ncbi:hypothetical protein AAVH_09988 [Aphelenchoides avenae]|nr:hypothetical protein AAVH_09988 [Aphelenchus avenae]
MESAAEWKQKAEAMQQRNEELAANVEDRMASGGHDDETLPHDSDKAAASDDSDSGNAESDASAENLQQQIESGCIILACDENKTDDARPVLGISNAMWAKRESLGDNGDVRCNARPQLVFSPALDECIEFYVKIRNDVGLPREVLEPKRAMFVDRHHSAYMVYSTKKNRYERFSDQASSLLSVAEP